MNSAVSTLLPEMHGGGEHLGRRGELGGRELEQLLAVFLAGVLSQEAPGADDLVHGQGGGEPLDKPHRPSLPPAHASTSDSSGP